ncbi:TRAP transporter small permease [Photobacterium rosenbergii]|uniref:TRAP transporter small permease protein n=1 Tax=Photobacterium rosenbergii TaxID=294936 RepID=A0A2T3NIY2_9GAMM|nr:TRAP transporter small permease [Photobacterium rosenbergii]MBY5944873.1 TRAP transporter small permease [Photobacterium rosenbergii]PSW15475.1 TRAP transporter small permease [Photobacterium rosenbergii]
MLRTIEKALNIVTTPLSRLLRHVAGILLLLMTAIVVAQVLFRYVFNIPLSWTDESSRFLMIYMTYLCLPFVYLADKNIAMTFLTEILEKKAPRVYSFLLLLGHISAMLVFSVWITFGWNFFQTGSVMADSLPIPMYYVYIMPPVMMAVTMLYAVQKSIASIRGMLGDFEDVSKTSQTAEMLESNKPVEDSDDTEQLELKPAA